MFTRNIALNCLKIYKVPHIINNVGKFSVVYDKHFEYFRNKAEYKNKVVQLNNELNESKVGGPNFSFLLKDHSIQTDGYFVHLMKRENVMKLTAQQVKDTLFLMANINIDTVKYAKVLRYLDEKCAVSIERWSLDLSFYILDAWFIIWGHKIFAKHYYSAITSLWGRRIINCSKYNLILMLYYIGMSKSAPPFLMESSEIKLENYIQNISDEALAVACLSFFKTSKPMTSDILLKHCCKAVENLFVKNDCFNAISILKCIRLSKFYDAKLWNITKDYALSHISALNFVECTNFLALFASQNAHDETLFNSLETHAITVLKNEVENMEKNEETHNVTSHPSLRSRVKDLARYLWALASMSHRMKAETLSVVTDIIKQRIDLGEYNTQMHILVDSLQSLSLAGCYPTSILPAVLNPSTFHKIQSSIRSKPKYQIYFVHKSTQIEEPMLWNRQAKNIYHPIPKSIERDLEERKGFKDLVDVLNKTAVGNFRCCYIMPHIMISGIILNVKNEVNSSETNAGNKLNIYKKYIADGIISREVIDIFQSDCKFICLEILDSTVCINNSDIPLGLMTAKIRQLTKLNFTVITLSTGDIENFTKTTSQGIGNLKKLLGLL